MKVKDLMTKDVGACDPQTNLASAVVMMWDVDCGILPVVDEQNKIVGVITDHDLSLAMATQNKLPGDVMVGEILQEGTVETCFPDDDVKKPLKIMGQKQVHRLPVVDVEGCLQGMLSINDLFRHCQEDSRDLSDKDVLEAMKAICAPQL